MFVFIINEWGLKNFIGVKMICNLYVFITTSGEDQESPTIISVEFNDGLSHTWIFFVLWGCGMFSSSEYFSCVPWFGSFLLSLAWCVVFFVDITPC